MVVGELVVCISNGLNDYKGFERGKIRYTIGNKYKIKEVVTNSYNPYSVSLVLVNDVGYVQ